MKKTFYSWCLLFGVFLTSIFLTWESAFAVVTVTYSCNDPKEIKLYDREEPQEAVSTNPHGDDYYNDNDSYLIFNHGILVSYDGVPQNNDIMTQTLNPRINFQPANPMKGLSIETLRSQKTPNKLAWAEGYYNYEFMYLGAVFVCSYSSPDFQQNLKFYVNLQSYYTECKLFDQGVEKRLSLYPIGIQLISAFSSCTATTTPPSCQLVCTTNEQ